MFGWKLTSGTKQKIDSIAVQYVEKIPALKLISHEVATILLVKMYDYDNERLDEKAVEQVLMNLLSKIQETISKSELDDIKATLVIQRAGVCWLARRRLSKRRRAATVIRDFYKRQKSALKIQCAIRLYLSNKQTYAVEIQCVFFAIEK